VIEVDNRANFKENREPTFVLSSIHALRLLNSCSSMTSCHSSACSSPELSGDLGLSSTLLLLDIFELDRCEW
jgi:hypothetical protein